MALGVAARSNVGATGYLKSGCNLLEASEPLLLQTFWIGGMGCGALSCISAVLMGRCVVMASEVAGMNRLWPRKSKGVGKFLVYPVVVDVDICFCDHPSVL